MLYRLTTTYPAMDDVAFGEVLDSQGLVSLGLSSLTCIMTEPDITPWMGMMGS